MSWRPPGPMIGKPFVFFFFFFVYLLRFCHFLVFFVPLQALAIKSCQNLKKYKKNNLPKPEEVPKKQKKIFMSWRPPGPKIGKSCFFFVFFGTSSGVGIFCFFCTSSGFGNKIVPKPEEAKKNKCQNLKMYKQHQKTHRFSCLGGPQARR